MTCRTPFVVVVVVVVVEGTASAVSDANLKNILFYFILFFSQSQTLIQNA